MDESKNGKFGRGMGAGIAIGAGVGVALGVAMDSIALGIAIGMGMGVALGATLGASKEPADAVALKGRGPLIIVSVVVGLLLLAVLTYLFLIVR